MKKVEQTEEQYSKIIKKMQKKNLESDDFVKAFELVKEYMNRDYCDIEHKFFKLYNKFKKQQLLYRMSYNQSKGNYNKALKYFQGMLYFINELPDEVIEANCILKRMKIVFNQGYKISMKSVSTFISEIENDKNNIWGYSVELPLPKKLSSCILYYMPTEILEFGGFGVINCGSLPKEYIGYYHKYNYISITVNDIIKTILDFQIMIILEGLPNKIAAHISYISENKNGKKIITVDFNSLPQRKKEKMRELK